MGCHNTETSYGGLNMTTIEGLKKGGGSGAAIVGKNLNKSLLYKRLTFSQENENLCRQQGSLFLIMKSNYYNGGLWRVQTILKH